MFNNRQQLLHSMREKWLLSFISYASKMYIYTENEKLVFTSNVLGFCYRNSVSSWIGTILERSGFEVYHHNFSTHQIKGSNVYGILRAGRSSSTEALLLSAPISLGVNEEKNFGIVILLGLADYLSSKSCCLSLSLFHFISLQRP